MGANIKIKWNFFNSLFLPDDSFLKSTIKWSLFILFIFIIQTKVVVFNYHLNLIILVLYAFIIHTVRMSPKKEEFHNTECEIKCSAFGAFIGILDDIISTSIIGPSFLSKSLVGFFGAILFGNIFFKWTITLGFIAIFFLTIFDGLAQFIIRIIISDFEANYLSIAQMIAMQSLVNIPFSLLFRADDSK